MTNTNFKIKAVKFSPEEIEKIESFLKYASHTIGADAPLDWEMREFSNRQIWDALQMIRARKQEAEGIAEGIAEEGIAEGIAELQEITDPKTKERILNEIRSF